MLPIGLVGIVALIVAVICGFVAYAHRRKVHAMVVTETYTARELSDLHTAAAQAAGPGAFRQRCEVVGVAAPGPRGSLVSEFGKQECVWYRHAVTRVYWGSSGGSGEGPRRREETVAEHVSNDPFAVVDDTGAVLVRAGDAKPNEPLKSVDRYEPAEGESVVLSTQGFEVNVPIGTIGYKYEEWILPPGQRLYVLGEASDASGELVVGKPESGKFVVSTTDETQLIRHARLRQRVYLAIAVFAALVAAADVILWNVVL